MKRTGLVYWIVDEKGKKNGKKAPCTTVLIKNWTHFSDDLVIINFFAIIDVI